VAFFFYCSYILTFILEWTAQICFENNQQPQGALPTNQTTVPPYTTIDLKKKVRLYIE
jgi:hypothetical protein